MNAMEAMAQTAPPREIIIRSDKNEDGRIRVAVEDRGPGVDTEIAPRIFEPFFSTKSEGTGMGLQLFARSIVEARTMAVCGQKTLLMAAPSFGSAVRKPGDESENRIHNSNLRGPVFIVDDDASICEGALEPA